MAMTSEQPFSPLCDLRHSPMRHVMLEEEREEIRTYYGCARRDCTRIFRESYGYSDRTEGRFDDSRAVARKCPVCGSVLYLASVNRFLKIETWECLRADCGYSGESRSPAAR